jgi:pyruvate dehydrogenase E2 component (dihydrolipoamide acetyltransferase)
MASEITIPRLGWNMDEGVFVGWLKGDGESVRPGDAIFSLESEKATQDIECFDGGTLRIPPNGPKAGDKLAVGAVIGYVVRPGETVPFEGGTDRASSAKAVEPPADATPAASPAVRRRARELGVDLRQLAGTGPGGRITAADVQRSRPAPAVAQTEADTVLKQSPPRSRPAISPRARRVATELGIDWTQLRGSGRTGRIREKDVRTAATAKTAVAEKRPTISGAADQAVPVTPVRRTIADRMLASARSTAAVTLTTAADATNLVNLRNQFKAVAGSGDVVPSYTDLLVKLTALALRDHALLNARWDGEQIVVARQVHIGIAVETDAGLLVPVIRDVPGLGLKQLAAQANDLAARARQRKLRPEEMHGGTFTITNLGAFGIDAFTPIINYPQCAILGVGRIQRQPVVVGEQVVARDRITLSLTFDHRIVDGAPAARFLQALVRHVENPAPCLVW